MTGYTLGQFANFIRPGYVMVGATFNPSPEVFVTAYAGSGTLVVVAVNTNTVPASQTFSISGMSVSSMIPTVTSSNLSMVQEPGIPVTGGNFTATLPAQSTTTFVSVSSPILVNAQQSNGAFQFSFTGIAPLQYTVLTSTNLSLPLSSWTVAVQPQTPETIIILSASPWRPASRRNFIACRFRDVTAPFAS